MEYNELVKFSLTKAMEYEYIAVPGSEEHAKEHNFSEYFEIKMKAICKISRDTYKWLHRVFLFEERQQRTDMV